MSDITAILLDSANGRLDSEALVRALLDHPTWYMRRRDDGFTELHARLDADSIGAKETPLLDALEHATYLRVASGGLGQIFDARDVEVMRDCLLRETGARLVRELDRDNYDALFTHPLFIGAFDNAGAPVATGSRHGAARAAFVTYEAIVACKATLASELARAGITLSFHRLQPHQLFSALTHREVGVLVQAFGPGRSYFVTRERCAAIASRAR